MERTIDEINEKIKSGEANIFSAHELKELIKINEAPSFDEVDVVTTGTCGIMSGTAAIFHIPVAEGGAFKKAKNIYLNGVPGFCGPCPNEWLGSVDLIVYGTSHSVKDSEYGGGFLFKDIVAGEEIAIEVESTDGEKFESTITIDDIGRAEMIGTRMAFKNYTAFTNPSDDEVSSIFNAYPMEGNLSKFSFSGCGDINPLANDPKQNAIKNGTKILINGAEGVVLGNGTRSTEEKPNLMLAADMHKMNKEFLGGFKTGSGPEVFNSVAIPIPVLNEEIFKNLLILNKDIPLPVADIRGRHLPLDEITYSDVWDKSDERPIFDNDKCINCGECLVEERCPTFAFIKEDIGGKLIEDNCYGCGICDKICLGDAFKMDLGSIKLNLNSNIHKIDITCRQSDKKRGKDLANDLKERIQTNDFSL